MRWTIYLIIQARQIPKTHEFSKSFEYPASCLYINWPYFQLKFSSSFYPEHFNQILLTLCAPTWYYGYFYSCFWFAQANYPCLLSGDKRSCPGDLSEMYLQHLWVITCAETYVGDPKTIFKAKEWLILNSTFSRWQSTLGTVCSDWQEVL